MIPKNAKCGAVLLALASTSISQAQTANWFETVEYDLTDPAKSVAFKPAAVTSGTATGTANNITLGYLSSGSGDTVMSPDHFDALSQGDYVKLSLTFDHIMDGGVLGFVSSLQNDFIISIDGGDATFQNIDTVFVENTGGTGYAAYPSGGTVSGDLTDTMTFMHNMGNNWGYYFRGNQGIKINGTWNTISIIQFSDESYAAAYDSAAGFTLANATVTGTMVPEPSAAALAGLAGLGTLLLSRRRTS